MGENGGAGVHASVGSAVLVVRGCSFPLWMGREWAEGPREITDCDWECLKEKESARSSPGFSNLLREWLGWSVLESV